MGKITNLAYNIGTSLNQEGINTHRQGITPTAQTLQGLSPKEQLAIHESNQALLDTNQKQLSQELESGDELESKTIAGQIAQNKYNYCAEQGVSREDRHSYIRQQNLDNLGTVAEDAMVLASVYRGGVGRSPVRSTVTNSTPKTFIPNDKFNYFFGRVKNDPHNTPRSLQNKEQLASIGIHDNAQGRKIISDTVENSVGSSSNIISAERKIGRDGLYYDIERRETLIIGPGGIRKLEMGFEIMPNGQRKLTTIIVKGGS
ncbi:hypothetical protein [Moraxella cuniculi]|uniref:Filamentous hemagglutinin n=1 Tax=Moraxella cuniculi TaxID=34061 RepID=A0A3S5EG08_9GAMM|nr:hypothetical protein [Moraxella cuniculi]VEG13745.1 Uncharacterised protein [Moraxella cuniculi]